MPAFLTVLAVSRSRPFPPPLEFNDGLYYAIVWQFRQRAVALQRQIDQSEDIVDILLSGFFRMQQRLQAEQATRLYLDFLGVGKRGVGTDHVQCKTRLVAHDIEQFAAQGVPCC